MRAALILLALLVGGYAWWTFPEDKADPETAACNDGSNRPSELSSLATQALENVLDGHVDACSGVFTRWKHRATAIPAQLGVIDDPIDEATYECLAKLDFAVGGLYFGWRDLGYPSCIAAELAPSPLASSAELRTSAETLINEAKQLGKLP